MSHKIDWIEYNITDEEVAQAQEERDIKDERLKNDNIFDSPHRWAGTLGELAVMKWFQDQNVTYEYFPTLFRKDIKDFKVKTLNIDVKTRTHYYDPECEDMALVANNQLGNTNVNFYIFCWFVPRFKKITILGHCSKKTFLDYRTEFEQGELVDRKYLSAKIATSGMRNLDLFTPSELSEWYFTHHIHI